MAETKLECAEKIVQMYQMMLHQATGTRGAGGAGSSVCETPGSGSFSTSMPTPISNPFADFFKKAN